MGLVDDKSRRIESGSYRALPRGLTTDASHLGPARAESTSIPRIPTEFFAVSVTHRGGFESIRRVVITWGKPPRCRGTRVIAWRRSAVSDLWEGSIPCAVAAEVAPGEKCCRIAIRGTGRNTNGINPNIDGGGGGRCYRPPTSHDYNVAFRDIIGNFHTPSSLHYSRGRKKRDITVVVCRMSSAGTMHPGCQQL